MGVVVTVKECFVGAVDLGEVAASVVHEHQAAPCAVVAAAIRGARSWRFGAGAAGQLWPGAGAPRAALDTLFDLASLSKPVVALTLARVERSGAIRRSQQLGDALPELSSSPSGAVPIDLLAAHRSGLEAHRELFVAQANALQRTPQAALAEAAQSRRGDCLGQPPDQGFAPVYSDLGYMLVGAALEAATRLPLDELVYREISQPLGLRLGSARQHAAALGSHEAFVARTAPTEVVAWRGGMLRGIVHDENAWVIAAEGMAGHAGAFADAGSVVLLGVAVLDALSGRRRDWLTAVELEPLLARRRGGTHCAGFDRRGSDAPMSGRYFGPETFGHLGFTGTSLWIDPERELVAVLLTNRVHPTRASTAIRAARPAAYDRLWQIMTALEPR